MSSKKDNINIVAIFNILGPIILNGINFITIPIFTKILGTENYGMYTIYYTWVNTFTILVSLQAISSVGTAGIKLPKEDIKPYYSSIVSLILLSFGVWLIIILMGMPKWVDLLGMPSNMVLLMIFHALGMAFVNFTTMRYTFEKKAHMTFSISVTIAVASVVLSLILLQGDFTEDTLYFGRSYGAAIPYLVLGAVVAVVYLIQGKKLYKKSYWKFCLTLCLPIIFHSLSQLILAQADKIMLKELMSDSAVGIYSFTYTFAHIMNIIYSAFNNTWVPFYYEDVKANRIEAIHKRTKNYIFLFTMISVGFILLAPDVIKLFAGEDFWSGIPLIPIFVLANYMMFLYSFPVNYEFYHQKTVNVAIGTCGAAILNCVLNYLLIPVMGMTGAALATLVSYVLLWLFHHMISKYVVKEGYHYKIREFLPGLLVIVGMSVLVWLIEDYILIRWILAVIAGIWILRHLIREKSIF